MSDLFGKITLVNPAKSKKNVNSNKRGKHSNSKNEIENEASSSSEDEHSESGEENGSNLQKGKAKSKSKSKQKENFIDVYYLQRDINDNYQVNSDVWKKVKNKYPTQHDNAISLITMYFIRRAYDATIGNQLELSAQTDKDLEFAGDVVNKVILTMYKWISGEVLLLFTDEKTFDKCLKNECYKKIKYDLLKIPAVVNENDNSNDDSKIDEEFTPMVRLLEDECLSKKVEFLQTKDLFVRGLKIMAKYLAKNISKQSRRRRKNNKLSDTAKTDILTKLNAQIDQFTKGFSNIMKHDLGNKENAAKTKKAFVDLIKGEISAHVETL